MDPMGDRLPFLPAFLFLCSLCHLLNTWLSKESEVLLTKASGWGYSEVEMAYLGWVVYSEKRHASDQN